MRCVCCASAVARGLARQEIVSRKVQMYQKSNEGEIFFHFKSNFQVYGLISTPTRAFERSLARDRSSSQQNLRNAEAERNGQVFR